jgi:hypothetical protein
MKKYIAAVAFAATSVYAFGQDVNKLIQQNDVERIIKTLAADDMQGRATFSPGIDKAATFIESEFKKAGLQPLKGATSFRQSFTQARMIPLKTTVTLNGTPLGPENAFVAGAASFTYNLTGDSVYVVNLKAGETFMSLRRMASTIPAGKKLVIVCDPANAEEFKTRRAAALKPAVARGGGRAQQPTIYLLGNYSNINSLQITHEVKTEQSPLFNVAGIIPGKSKADEFVVFSGHYDHLGIGKPTSGDSIYNGADDDASGTTAVIELAKYYKKLNNNERTLIFVAFTAEEIGGFGSQYFSKQLDPEKVVAMFNIEMIGKVSKFGANSAFITGYERSDFGEILQKNLKGTAFQFHPDPYTEQNLFYRSDNATLAALGVPAHTISTDQIDTDKNYHQVSDDFSTMDAANITATIRAIALSSRTIVSGKEAPKRIPKLEPRR